MNRAGATSIAAIAVCSCAISAHAQLPQVKTQTAGPVRAISATLNGMAVPKGNATRAWFEWGADTNYGNTTAPQSIGSANGVVRVSAVLTNLIEGNVYHFRLVASNSVGIVGGFDFRFTTAMRVQNWGSYLNGLPSVPSGLTNLCGVASGHIFSLGLRNDGTVVSWLIGYTVPASSYVETNVPAGLSNVVAMAGGFSHSLALKEDGTVFAWGKYADGTAADVPANLTNVISIGGGDLHSAALKADGKVVAWGKNTYPNATNVPSGLSNVVALACGTGHTLALKADGTVTVWGSDGAGSLPAPSSATNVVAIATMGVWNLALRGDGTVVEFGQSLPSDVPKPSNLTNAVAIATGNAYAEVLNADGMLEAWGVARDATNISPSLSNVVAMASGDYHMVGLAPVNLPPMAFARNASGGINAALTIPLTRLIFDPNGDPITMRIVSLPLKGTLHQYTPGGPGAAISTTGTMIADPAFRVIFVPTPNDYGSPYTTLSIVANDGEFDSLAATCTINILAPPRPTIQALGISGPPVSFTLGFTGISNTIYSVWYSDTLRSWTNLGPATQTAPGEFSFIDYSITNAPVRFYRVQFP